MDQLSINDTNAELTFDLYLQIESLSSGQDDEILDKGKKSIRTQDKEEDSCEVVSVQNKSLDASFAKIEENDIPREQLEEQILSFDGLDDIEPVDEPF